MNGTKSSRSSNGGNDGFSFRRIPTRPSRMRNAPLRLVVLDCDGTMVDSQTAIVGAMTGAFEALNLTPPAADEVKRIVGLDLADAISCLVSEDAHHHIDDLVEGYKTTARAHRDSGNWEDPLYPQTVETIEALAGQGWIIGCATGKSMRGLAAVFELHGIGHHFSTCQTSDIGPGKPSPEMLYRAMSETGVDKPYSVMVGDTTFDMEMARNAGIHAIGVSWGYHEVDELREAGANVIIHSYSELIEALEELTGR